MPVCAFFGTWGCDSTAAVVETREKVQLPAANQIGGSIA